MTLNIEPGHEKFKRKYSIKRERAGHTPVVLHLFRGKTRNRPMTATHMSASHGRDADLCVGVLVIIVVGRVVTVVFCTIIVGGAVGGAVVIVVVTVVSSISPRVLSV